jgi:hypothetical protein
LALEDARVADAGADELDDLLVLGERAAVEGEAAPDDVGAELRLRDRIGAGDGQLADALKPFW